MTVKELTSRNFSTVDAYDGVRKVEELLLEEKYLVVMEDNQYQGILTSSDLILRPHKIIIDCLTPKDKVQLTDSVLSVYEKFYHQKTPALPVFNGEQFLGIIDFLSFISKLRNVITELHQKTLITESVKTAFLGNLSHEIRTPLNGILGFMDIILQLNNDELINKGEEYFTIVKSSADKFLLVMNDLVDLARINSGERLHTKFQPFLLRNVFDELKNYFETTNEFIKNKNIHFIIYYPEREDQLISDVAKIKHILFHLIDNALKFSTDNHVFCQYSIDVENFSISITNHGIEIPQENREQIFAVFEKQSNDNNAFEGLGIGLPLIKKLTEILDGEISFNSEENETSFRVTFPRKKELQQ